MELLTVLSLFLLLSTSNSRPSWQLMVGYSSFFISPANRCIHKPCHQRPATCPCHQGLAFLSCFPIGPIKLEVEPPHSPATSLAMQCSPTLHPPSLCNVVAAQAKTEFQPPVASLIRKSGVLSEQDNTIMGTTT
jgi:hypothetical protein